ncbi:MAG TPA: ribonucleotide-diphosphate reductase subunit alpha, partial [Bacillota bacterium]|nr:ribonucleotide-diphosphate reductase subunit alpha [Bacillota bacterium]
IIEQLRGIRCPACIRRPGITVTSCPDAISRALLRQFPNLQRKMRPASTAPTQFDQLPLLHSSGVDEVVTAQTAGIMQSALPVSNPCPECGQELIPGSGCYTCSNCGYSKCG